MICTGNLLQHFYPRSPCGERRNPARRPTGRRRRFLSTLSLRRATAIGRRDRAGRDISIHALLAESDIIKPLYHRGATSRFLSTLSLRRATPRYAIMIFIQYISIHALLAESDLGNVAVGLPISNFYPRSPCGERRFSSGAKADTVSFLSTLSLRRATPRPPKKHQWPDISIHALLAESDSIIVLIIRHVHAFLSTLSLRRATSLMLYDTSSLIFLSTLSLRRATQR